MKKKLHAELIFIWKVSHLDSLWNRGTRELGNGLLVEYICNNTEGMEHNTKQHEYMYWTLFNVKFDLKLKVIPSIALRIPISHKCLCL